MQPLESSSPRGDQSPPSAAQLLWVAAAASAGLLAGLCVSEGDYMAVAWAALLLLGVGNLARRVSQVDGGRALVALAVCAGALHMLVGIAIQGFAPTFAGGFVTGDDAAYYRLASHVAAYLRGSALDPSYGPPLWGGDAYLFGAFVYLETALFTIFGPDVRMPILLNGALAIVAALVVFHMTKRLFGPTAGFVAAAIVAFFPSLVLWSALNLKDSLTIALAVTGVWATVQFQLRPRATYFAIQFVAAEALILSRAYVAAAIAIAAFASVAVTVLPRRWRTAATALAAVLTAVILVQSLNAIGSGVGGQLLLAFERERAAMAVGARTGFVPTPTPLSTPVATATASAAVTTPASSPSANATTATSAISTTPTAAVHPDDVALAPGRTLSYLPTGLAYAIFAPFPLSARRLQEVIAAPDMLAWYVLVAASAATLWRERRRWSYLAPFVVTIGGLILVFALAEGNVGTLFRHRAVVIPFAASLASPSLVAFLAWIRNWTSADPAQQRPPAGEDPD